MKGPCGVEGCDCRYIIDHLLESLDEITKREGAFSRDELTHARNTVDNMETVARDAIKWAASRGVAKGDAGG